MTDRKAALDMKKAKLQAIRESKERKRRELEAKGSLVPELLSVSGGEVGGTGVGGHSPLIRDHVREVDEMLSSLGVGPVSDVLSSLSSNASLPPEDTNAANSAITATPPSSISISTANSSIVTPRSSMPRTLTVVKCSETNIPGKEIISYTKQTQTTASGHERDGSSSSSASSKGFMEDWWRPRKAHTFGYYVLTFDETEADDGEDGGSLVDGSGGVGGPAGSGGGFHSKLPPGILPAGLPQVKAVAPAVTAAEPLSHVANAAVQPASKPPRELTAEERQAIMMSDAFQRFFDRTGRVVERALAERADFTTDYTGINEDDEANEDRSSLRVVLNRQFEDERWTRHRCVTALDWSPHFPELLLASYHQNDDPHEPDGVCLVWNTKFKKHTPEFVFHCQSPVTTAIFAKFHPNLIIGGTYSGQIVLWDNRVHKRTPIQRTPLSASAHTHPVYCVSVVGTQNAHNLIGISTDGRMCSWSLDMLSQPQETLELQAKQKKPVAVTALAFPPNDVNNFLIGSEDGSCHQACRHGNRAGIIESYEAHQGPVTGVAVHNGVGSIDFSHMFLTSSFDWTVKLWSMKDGRPVHSFEHNSDYVYDVRWSPVHPAVFAAVDGTGRLDLWHLNTDTEVPVAGATVTSAALNRVQWAPSGGHLVAGDDAGRLLVYEVGEGLSQPRVDEWNKMMYTLQDLKNNHADQELERANQSPYNTTSTSGPNSLVSMTSSPSPYLYASA